VKRITALGALANEAAFALAFIALVIASPDARSQELRIGHLEATDDPGGINWAFFHCQQNGQVMECDVFQTLIHHELSPDQRAEYINKSMQDDLKQFTDKRFCDSVSAVKRISTDAVKTGKGADGRPISLGQAQATVLVMGAADDACRNPNLTTARHAFEAMDDQKMKTCKVLNDYSHSQFKWNLPTQSWIFQSGPTGSCGIVIVGTLERDKNADSSASKLATATGAAGFWLYTERHMYTDRSGVLPNGLSCGGFPDITLHYTWKAALNFSDCMIIENWMN